MTNRPKIDRQLLVNNNKSCDNIFVHNKEKDYQITVNMVEDIIPENEIKTV